ncbi:hypothetical protein [Polycladospora coralii]|nr:hypothetical protein [Polycladospora coralii]
MKTKIIEFQPLLEEEIFIYFEKKSRILVVKHLYQEKSELLD